MMIIDGKRELEIVLKMESMEVIFVGTDEEGGLETLGSSLQGSFVKLSEHNTPAILYLCSTGRIFVMIS